VTRRLKNKSSQTISDKCKTKTGLPLPTIPFDLVADKSDFVAEKQTTKVEVLLQPRTRIPEKDCSIPDDWLYPLCKNKVQVKAAERAT